MSRKRLDVGSLDDFTPRSRQALHTQPDHEPAAKPKPKLQSAPGGAGNWDRREAPQEGQFTIRAPLDVIARFKARCRPPKGGRFTYGEMLEMLMDDTEGQGSE